MPGQILSCGAYHGYGPCALPICLLPPLRTQTSRNFRDKRMQRQIAMSGCDGTSLAIAISTSCAPEPITAPSVGIFVIGFCQGVPFQRLLKSYFIWILAEKSTAIRPPGAYLEGVQQCPGALPQQYSWFCIKVGAFEVAKWHLKNALARSRGSTLRSKEQNSVSQLCLFPASLCLEAFHH